MTKARLIIVSGASGSGKTTLVDLLEKVLRPKHLRRLRSVTTKNKQPGDESTYHYIFPGLFQELVAAKMFLWTEEVHGNFYGTAEQDLKQALESSDCTVAVIAPDCLTKMNLEAQKRGCKKDEMLFLHVLSPGEEELRRRFAVRGDDPASIERRLADCVGWDGYVRTLALPIVFIENKGSLGDLEHRVCQVLKGR